MSVDRWVWEWVIDHRSTVATSLYRATTTLANTETVIVVTTLAALALVVRQRRDLAIRLVATVVGAWLTSSLLKVVIHRQRPPLLNQLVTAGGYSFPSGHATQSIALYASMMTVVCVFGAQRFRSALAVAAVLIAIVIGTSRIYLGVHWFTDVVAGWIVGAAWWWVAWQKTIRFALPRGEPGAPRDLHG